MCYNNAFLPLLSSITYAALVGDQYCVVTQTGRGYHCFVKPISHGVHANDAVLLRISRLSSQLLKFQVSAQISNRIGVLLMTP